MSIIIYVNIHNLQIFMFLFFSLKVAARSYVCKSVRQTDVIHRERQRERDRQTDRLRQRKRRERERDR